ncbi:unnamed protein product [Mytilus edulis]|uniref:BTB domain-containing protein n=1 Tax=Mytilus edulis TaxID=6550 RepID=A0A8S3V4W4_MYTED|nr:unnamed protein product [Mytilus edulis]
MEQTAKKLRTEEQTQEGKPPKISFSPFNFPDLTIKIRDEKLYINKYHLMEVSPVFQKMLTGDFKEKNASEIELPDEDPTTFALFLRHTHCLVLNCLNLQSLAVHVKGNKYLEKPITYYATEKLMDDILKAELFNLPHFLTECLKHAYKLSYKVCIKNPKFHRMSSDTKSKLLLMRCEELELGIEKCLAVLGRTDLYGRCKSCDDRKRVEEAKTILDSNELNRSRSLDL